MLSRLGLFLTLALAALAAADDGKPTHRLLAALSETISPLPHSPLTLFHAIVVGFVAVAGVISLIAIVAHRVYTGRPIINFGRTHTISVAEDPYPMV